MVLSGSADFKSGGLCFAAKEEAPMFLFLEKVLEEFAKRWLLLLIT
jgi:hypothetical protein